MDYPPLRGMLFSILQLYMEKFLEFGFRYKYRASLVMLLWPVALWPQLPSPPACSSSSSAVTPGHSWLGGAEGDRCTPYLLLSPLTRPLSALLPGHSKALTPLLG